jgi:hypothetical protein
LHAHTGSPVRPFYGNVGVVVANVVAILIAVGIFGMLERGQGWHAVGVHRVSATWLFCAAGIGLLCILVSGSVFLLIERWQGHSFDNPQNEFLFPSEESLQDLAKASSHFP